MRNTRKSGQILRSKKRPRPTLRSGRGSRTNSNTSRQLPARVIEANKVNVLSGVSFAVLVGRDLVDVNCVGWAHKETQTPLRVDHIFRVFSNTKLVTSSAALLLFAVSARASGSRNSANDSRTGAVSWFEFIDFRR